MPKVNDAYFENKKNAILDAAYSVSMKKPLYSVTMSDIISETGLSQGGVYKYFSSIDDILGALINRGYQNYNFEKDIEKIISNNAKPEVIISEIFLYMANHNQETITGYGKINFELNSMGIASPDRYLKIRSQLSIADSFDYLKGRLFSYITENVDNGYFKPTVPLNEISAFIIAGYEGILSTCTIIKCYPNNPINPPYEFDVKRLILSLKDYVLIMLGNVDTF